MPTRSAPAEQRPLTFVTGDGLTLRGVIGGGTSAHGADGAPPRVLFLPGVGFPVQCYVPALTPLFARTVVAGLNHRGHGDSDNPQALRGWPPYRQDIHDFIRQRMQPPVILGGHSFGSMLSLWLAAECPELVDGLLLLDPLYPGTPAEPWPPHALERAQYLLQTTHTRRSRWPSPEEAETALRGRGVFAGWCEAALQAYLRVGLLPSGEGRAVQLACPLEVERELFSDERLQHSWDWVPQVRAPVAILRGATSHVSLHHHYRALAASFALASVFTVRGAHTFPMEQPAATGEALVAACTLLERSRGGTVGGL
ncbi:MAG: alpha/beta hydrolase [Candidatus Lambdaproteobacteria bacterium]|nr:alpha/beta hydrolase [Candidatus Lambdaproteobacteria bacterium]